MGGIENRRGSCNIRTPGAPFISLFPKLLGKYNYTYNSFGK